MNEINLTAFSEGRDARLKDDEDGTLTDCPYTAGLQAAVCWYRGYNYDEEEPETLAEIRAMPNRSYERRE